MHDSLLVVEDLPSTYARLVWSLEHCGYRPVGAFTDPAALELVEERELALALVELRLAGMGGLQLCREIRKRRRELPVAMICSSSDREMVRAAGAAGACDLLVTPVDLGELCYRIECARKRGQLEQGAHRLQAQSAPWLEHVGLVTVH